jgi:glycosyltransferase involved in cell wall biosynthesis
VLKTSLLADQNPLVSVCMIAYNVEPYIAEAIDGVLSQQTDFPVELVIGEDCSTDRTREIAQAYADKYPERIRLLPSDVNRGIAGNAFRTWQYCRGKYIAVCDSDDIWTDPFKLKHQVSFLENNPEYGAVYSDVEVISNEGTIMEDPVQDKSRERYAAGKVFFPLMKGNFINNSTAVFRRDLIADYEVDQDRNYYTHDYLLWLHVSMHSKIHFINTRTAKYRKHHGGVTNSGQRENYNREVFQRHLPGIIVKFDRCYPWELSKEERIFIFQKMISVLYRKNVPLRQKRQILQLMPKYFPGMPGIFKIFFGKVWKQRSNYKFN